MLVLAMALNPPAGQQGTFVVCTHIAPLLSASARDARHFQALMASAVALVAMRT